MKTILSVSRILLTTSAVMALGLALATPLLAQETKKIVERNGNNITEIIFEPASEQDIPVDKLRARLSR